MQPLEATGPNAEQIKYWNESAGPKWTALQDQIDAHIGAIGQRGLERAAVAVGERVLDVGCGCGTTTLDIARRVGPSGTAVGVDISAVMLERARRSARAAALENVRFEQADAQTHAFPPSTFDLCYSRFGVMFFIDPATAFINLRRALRPGGRLTFICWRPLPENPWMLVPMMAAAQHIEFKVPPSPDAPGPFAFGDSARVQKILSDAGYAGINIEPLDATLGIGGATDLDSAVEFLLQLGPTGTALRDSDPALLPRVAAAVREALEPYHSNRGVQMAAAAWIVSATNNG